MSRIQIHRIMNLTLLIIYRVVNAFILFYFLNVRLQYRDIYFTKFGHTTPHIALFIDFIVVTKWGVF